MNNLLFVISIIGIFSALLFVKKFFGKEGLVGWIGLVTVLANILVIKNVRLLGIDSTLSNVLFASNFLATDMLTEAYGVKWAKRGVFFGAFCCFSLFIVSQYSLLYTPTDYDFGHAALKQVFEFTPRISIASLILFVLSNFVDVRLYDFLRRKHNGKKMWFRNNVSTIISNGAENFLFAFIVFGGTMPAKEIVIIAAWSTIIEVLVALLDTPFLYLSKTKFFEENKIA